MRRSSRHGFTHSGLVAIVLTGLVGASVATTGLSGVRADARSSLCEANLGWLGALDASYASDNQDLIVSYSWRAGSSVQDDWIQHGWMRSDGEAFQWQQTWILRRLTGRVEGEDRILNNSLTLPHRRFNHVVLHDYAAYTLPLELFACPEERRCWLRRPIRLI